MARVIALAYTPSPRAELEVLRIFTVCGCAIALIAAGHPLPF